MWCIVLRPLNFFEYMSRLMTKSTKLYVHPAKTQMSQGIRPVWSESSLSAWRKLGSLATERTAKTLIRLGRCPRWSESSLAFMSFCWFCTAAAQWWWSERTAMLDHRLPRLPMPLRGSHLIKNDCSIYRGSSFPCWHVSLQLIDLRRLIDNGKYTVR